MRKLVLLLLLICCGVSKAQENASFQVRENGVVQEINRTFSFSTTIKPWRNNNAISALGIDAEVALFSDTALVRVFLESEDGGLYLILEANPMLTKNKRTSVQRYAEETAHLDALAPKQLKLVVKDATLRIHRLHTSPKISLTQRMPTASLLERRKLQVEAKVASINAYNKRLKKLWRAKTTDIALLPFMERQKMMGLSEDGVSFGFEYYGGGIFDFSYTTPQKVRQDNISSPFVKEFDWRNRHGKNWITPPKKQFGYTCWIFSACGLLESYFNCYHNNLYNIDLSEFQLVLKKGGYAAGFTTDVFSEAKYNGIIDEECSPFVITNSVNNYTICEDPDIRVKIGSYYYVSTENASVPRLKRDLIKSPISLDLFWSGVGGHSMLLTSYRNLEKGDVIIWDAYDNIPGNLDYDTISGNYENKTLWTLKNSYGSSWGENGYVNLIFDNISSWRYCGLSNWIKNTTSVPFEHRIVDEDNDGFYIWGGGQKPQDLPAWVEMLQDGDDSNPLLGSMDEYGHCKVLTPNTQDTLYIDTDTIWEEYKYLYQHVMLRNGAKLIIRCENKFHSDVTITVSDRCILKFSNAVLQYPKIIAQGSGQVFVEKSNIQLSTDKSSYMNLNNYSSNL